jgi:pimeloyl-ACP methyl ester carboxylesterase
MRVGRLHTHAPGWSDANIAWMRSGGYAISARIPEVQQPTLVLWGRQDQILEAKYAGMFEAALPDGRLQWIEECGHCGHLEKPVETAAAILQFTGAAHAPGGGKGQDASTVPAAAAAAVAATVGFGADRAAVTDC